MTPELIFALGIFVGGAIVWSVTRLRMWRDDEIITDQDVTIERLQRRLERYEHEAAVRTQWSRR